MQICMICFCHLFPLSSQFFTRLAAVFADEVGGFGDTEFDMGVVQVRAFHDAPGRSAKRWFAPVVVFRTKKSMLTGIE